MAVENGRILEKNLSRLRLVHHEPHTWSNRHEKSRHGDKCHLNFLAIAFQLRKIRRKKQENNRMGIEPKPTI